MSRRKFVVWRCVCLLSCVWLGLILCCFASFSRISLLSASARLASPVACFLFFWAYVVRWLLMLALGRWWFLPVVGCWLFAARCLFSVSCFSFVCLLFPVCRFLLVSFCFLSSFLLFFFPSSVPFFFSSFVYPDPLLFFACCLLPVVCGFFVV